MSDHEKLKGMLEGIMNDVPDEVKGKVEGAYTDETIAMILTENGIAVAPDQKKEKKAQSGKK